MNVNGSSEPLETDTIKGLPVTEQARVLRSLVPRYLARAAPLRRVVEAQSGALVRIDINASDEEIVLLALLAAVADDIGTVPGRQRRLELLAINKSVAHVLRLEVSDLRFLIRSVSDVRKILTGYRVGRGSSPASCNR